MKKNENKIYKKNIRYDFLSIFSQLLKIPSPPGGEHNMAAEIGKILHAMGYEHEHDPAGNLLVRIKGKKKNGQLIIFSAHMDEIAMIVTAIEANGDIKVKNSGGLFPFKIGERPVEIITEQKNNLIGILSMGSAHSKGFGTSNISWNDICIKTGLSAKELENAGVKIGSFAVPVPDCRGPIQLGNLENPMLAAWSFDDRAGITELLLLLQEIKKNSFTPENSIIFAFTTKEEIGGHGARYLASRERPDIFIAVDGSPSLNGLIPDERPGIWHTDQKCVYDRQLIAEISNAAESIKISMQPVFIEGAFSDASLAYEIGAVARSAAIGHVRINSHGYEMCNPKAFSNIVKILMKYIYTL